MFVFFAFTYVPLLLMPNGMLTVTLRLHRNLKIQTISVLLNVNDPLLLDG